MAKRPAPPNDPLRRAQQERPGVAQITGPATAGGKRGPAPKYGKPRIEALPAQIAARVTQETFDQFAALRFAFGTGTREMSNTELLEKAAELLIKSMSPEQRKRYAFVADQK